MRELLAKFSVWKPWSDRLDLAVVEPGVYLLARFDSPQSKRKPTLSSKLIYIGETCGQTLRSRLHQFNRSAFLDRLGHSGGMTFASTYRKSRDPSWLHISVMPVDLVEPAASAYIRYVERALLWAYVKKHGSYPECNRK